MTDKSISFTAIEDFQKNLDSKPEASVVERAVTHNGIFQSAADFESNEKMKPVFSVEVPEKQDVANQLKSGRCWIYAALNTMRYDVEKNYKVGPKFELSQNFTNFWDKFEKANFFLENIIETADQPLDSRLVSFLLTAPQEDGGQWDMLCGIIEKYGIVPQSAMVETYNSKNSEELNSTLNLKLRHDAEILRKLVKGGKSADELEHRKDQMLNTIYRMLCYSLGTPTKKFDFEYRDKDNNYHIDQDLTPKEFFDKYVNVDLEDYVSVINSPTPDKPFNKTYSVEFLGNVVDGRQVKHLNLAMDDFKALAVKQLEAGQSVWFGSDVVQDSDRQKGIMDTNLYHKAQLFDTDLNMTKGAQLEYGQSMMDHAMVLTGVDIVDGKPTKWKVENSWGPKVGDKGYFVMSDDWFDKFVYQVVIDKQYMSEQQINDQAQAPIELKPWDPMGSLARY